MTKSKLSKGVRKFIRKEKARLRREIGDAQEFKKKAQELYDRYKK